MARLIGAFPPNRVLIYPDEKLLEIAIHKVPHKVPHLPPPHPPHLLTRRIRTLRQTNDSTSTTDEDYTRLLPNDRLVPLLPPSLEQLLQNTFW